MFRRTARCSFDIASAVKSASTNSAQRWFKPEMGCLKNNLQGALMKCNRMQLLTLLFCTINQWELLAF
jgi:hypothetical protein